MPNDPFEMPFDEAVAWFMEKGIVTPNEFESMSKELKQKSFSAAYTWGADELQTVYDAVLDAIATGSTLQEFVERTEDILLKPWHRETVFRTNVLSAYGRGHWQQAQVIKDQRPYARYSAVMDGRTRPTHAALHGMVYPIDSIFWKRYWPPWDYNCRCAAITLSQYEVDSLGLNVKTELGPDLPAPNNKFAGPASDQTWGPDLGKYQPEIASQLSEVLRKIQEVS